MKDSEQVASTGVALSDAVLASASHESTSPGRVARALEWEHPRDLFGGVGTKYSLGTLIALLVVTVAVLDFATPVQFIGAILFTLPLSLCALQRSKRMVWGTTGLAALLTIAGEIWGLDRADVRLAWLDVANRGFLIASLFTLATFIHLWINRSRRFELDTVEIERQSESLVLQNAQLEGLVADATRDIARRRAAEQQLAQMESRYRGLLEAAPDAMVVVDQGGKIVLLNLQAEKQFGYRRDELLGQPVTNIIPEGFAERLIADGTRTAAEALAQQIGTGIELLARRKDGSGFPIELMLSPLESAEGILVTAAIRDISVRKAAEEHLARAESRYRGLLEAAPDAMLLVNPAGEVVLINVQAKKQFGYGRGELLGEPVTNLIPEGFGKQRLAEALRSSEHELSQPMVAAIELTGRHRDGTEFPIEVMLSPLKSPEGLLLTMAIRDITTRKNAEAHLLRTVKDLNRSNEELGQFAYIASHDLQEPLRMVASYTQLLSKRYKGKLDTDADEFIAFAVDGAERMQRLIQDLLAYSRVGTKGRALVNVSSERVLALALENLRKAIEDSGAVVTSDPLPSILADEGQLVQLFQNLVGNAIKYQGPGIPRIHVSCVKSRDGAGATNWTFSVKDNGIGIEPKYFERIFGMFQRLHKREDFAGTGIGLAICKKIVERHGGSISVESAPGQGSTFRFALAGSNGKS